MVTGACFDFVAPFGADYGQLASLGDADFRQAVALGPTPTDQCCKDARTFVTGVSHLSPFACTGRILFTPSLSEGKEKQVPDEATQFSEDCCLLVGKVSNT